MNHSKKLAEMIARYESGAPFTYDGTEVQFMQTVQLARIATALESLVSLASEAVYRREPQPQPTQRTQEPQQTETQR